MRCAAPVAPSSNDAATAPRCVLTTLTPTSPTLGVSFYPDFLYDAGGDSVAARCGPLRDDGRRELRFDVAPVTAVNGASTSILVRSRHARRTARVAADTLAAQGISLPPFINIDIAPRSLSGWFEPATGRMELDFDASFAATILGRAFPPLSVVAPLRTGTSVGAQRSGAGVPLQASDGTCTLTAVARVPPTGDPLLDTFLQLPADALAVLPARVEFLSEAAFAERAADIGTRPPNAARAARAAQLWAAGGAGALLAIVAAAATHAQVS